MTQVQYTGSTPITIPALRLHLDPGGLADVDAVAAEELVERDDFKLASAAPVATVKEILARVDGDPVEAARELDEELATPNPRKSLVKALEQIVASAPDPDPDAATADVTTTEE